jgi:hypothetical protein
MNIRVTLDAMGLAKICLIDTVNFSKLDVLVFECRGCFLVVGSKSFAVATPMVKLNQNSHKKNDEKLPWSKELDQNQGFYVDGRTKCVLCKGKYIGRLGNVFS